MMGEDNKRKRKMRRPREEDKGEEKQLFQLGQITTYLYARKKWPSRERGKHQVIKKGQNQVDEWSGGFG